jgi:hypothetical protein
MFSFLTLERLRIYAVGTLMIGCLVLAALLWTQPQRLVGAADFSAFYNAGRIINEHSPSDLYNRNLQRQLFAELPPGFDPNQTAHFAYTPFFALLFSPLALLPYPIAFLAWTIISLSMFILGFQLVWNASQLPSKHYRTGLLMAVSFLPFYAWCLGMAQTSAFGFFFLALAIYLDHRKHFLSGCALALLLYKPPLLVLLIPMLLITKKWRTLAGFTCAGIVLALISMALIGLSGIPSYVAMITGFAKTKAGIPTTGLEIDAYSFFMLLTNNSPRLAIGLVLTLLVIIAPLLISSWKTNPRSAWATAITWTLVLNFYAIIYDATLLVLPVVLLIALIKVPRGLLITLFLVRWIETASSEHLRFQPMTAALIVFGCYVLYALARRQTELIFIQLGRDRVEAIS